MEDCQVCRTIAPTMIRVSGSKELLQRFKAEESVGAYLTSTIPLLDEMDSILAIRNLL